MIESLKATASESDFFARWAGSHTKLLNIQQRLGRLTQSLQLIPVLLSALATLVVLTLGSGYIMQGVITVGTLVAFQSLMESFSQPIVSLVNLGSSLQDVQAGLKRIEDVFNYRTGTEDTRTAGVAEKKVKLQGSVAMQGVTFGYSPLDPPLIRDFSLQIRPGARVAIVGRSGCGKSTVANLVSGLYAPWEGEILFDGKPRNRFTRATLNNSISMVDQNLFLFEGTVRENIALWDHTIADRHIIQAARDACIHDDIAARPGGYDSLIAENGKNLSGGQRQRFEIARALATSPSVLILDEATSALDARTEQMIDINLRKKGCTCLIIAHRISTIRDCDEIIVMDRGTVVQRGTHSELVAEGGHYLELIKE
jgi:ABC-type bacteriocin/lantibiotic exporter with double-glycine peptidase domain